MWQAKTITWLGFKKMEINMANKSYNEKQCKLRKGETHTTAWLPEKFAVKGNYVKLKQNGEWIDGWLVLEVSNVAMPYEEVRERGEDYKRQRKASDI